MHGFRLLRIGAVVVALMVALVSRIRPHTDSTPSAGRRGAGPDDAGRTTEEVIDERLERRCDELAAGVVSADAPSHLRFFATFSENITTNGDPTLLCVASAAGLRLATTVIR